MPLSVITRHRRHGGLGLFVWALGWLAASPARAGTEGIDEGATEGHGEVAKAHAHFLNAFVLKVAHVETRKVVAAPEGEEEEEESGRDVDRHSALGITFEHVLLEGWLNAEVGTLLSSAPGGQVAFPSTLLLKLPSELTDEVEVYFGAGVAVELEREKQWTPNWGAATAVGVYVWIAPETGFNFDVEQSFLLSEGVIAELALGAGVVTRF
jgi:hypothetical protein